MSSRIYNPLARGLVRLAPIALCLLAGSAVRAQSVYNFANHVQGSEVWAGAGDSRDLIPRRNDIPTTQLTTLEYDRIEVSDSVLYTYVSNTWFRYPQMRFAITIREPVKSIKKIGIVWSGRGESRGLLRSLDGARLSIWNEKKQKYELLTETANTPAQTTLTATVKKKIKDYLGGAGKNTLILHVSARGSSDFFGTAEIATDYIEVQVHGKTASIKLPPPVAVWHMDESDWLGAGAVVKDSGGNALDLTAYGGAAPTDAAPALAGQLGTCGYGTFDGSTQYLAIPDQRKLDLARKLAVSVWIRPLTIPSSGLKSILSKDENYEFHIDRSGEIDWWWRDSTRVQHTLKTRGAKITTGRWRHVAISYKNGRQLIFVDGVERASANIMGTLLKSARPLQVGQDQGIRSRFFHGEIDEVQIYGKDLKADQVAFLMNERHHCASGVTLGHYPFDEGTGQIAHDLSSAGYDATLGSATGADQRDPSWIAGTVGSGALDFDGRDDLLRTPDSTAALQLTGDYEISLWLRPNMTQVPGAGILAKTDPTGMSDHWSLSFDSNTKPKLVVNHPGGTWDTGIKLKNLDKRWHQIEIERTGNLMTALLDRKMKKSATFAPGPGTGPGHLVIGTDHTGAAATSYKGGIDDLLIFDPAATPSTSTLDHFVISHDGAGLHCLDEPVGVTAFDSTGAVITDYGGEIQLDTGNGIGDWLVAPGSIGTLVNATPNDGTAIYTFDPVEGGQANFLLRYRQGPAGVNVDVWQTGTPSLRDDDSEGTLAFSPSGFTITASALPNPPPQPIDDPVGTQVAARTFALHLAAYGQTPDDPICGVIESYAGPRMLRFWSTYLDPSSGTRSVEINGTPISGSQAGAGGQSVVFTTGAASAIARYRDVGRIRIDVEDVAPPAGAIRGATNPFVVRPAEIVISSVSRADGTPNPGSIDTGGAIFVAAGTAFEIVASVVDDSGQPTPNFGLETTPEALELSVASLVAPTGGLTGVIANGRAFSPDATPGRFRGSGFTYSEVGAVRLRASVADADYLGTGPLAGTPSSPVGRFTPFDFTVAYNVPSFATTCPSGGFSFAGQPIGYATGLAPRMTVAARNAQGATTVNYTGAFFRLSNASLSARRYRALTGTLDTSALPPASSDPAITDNGNGTASLLFSSGGGLSFQRAPASAPFDAQIELSLDVLDLDGVAHAGNPAAFGPGRAGGPIPFDSGASIYFGRLGLANANDSELVTLVAQLQTERFDGAGFVRAAADDCTSLALSALRLTAQPSGLPTTPSLLFDPVQAGDAGLRFSAPGAGHEGTIEVRVDLSAATGAGLPWLRYDWPSDGNLDGALDDDPSARMTFGIYHGRDRIIYQRELY